MQRIWTLLVAAAAAAIATTALAQDVPAVQGASEAEKARILGLIEGAKKEGSVTYWDVVIQPETNDALTAAFRKYYGLPSSFKVNYQLSATGTLVTRVEQEIARRPRHGRHRRRSARHPGCSSGRTRATRWSTICRNTGSTSRRSPTGWARKDSSPSTAPICSCPCGTRAAPLQRQIVEGRDRRGAGGPHERRRRDEVGHLSLLPTRASGRSSRWNTSRSSRR